VPLASGGVAMPDHFFTTRRRLSGLALAFALLAPGLVNPLAAAAETVLERAARTGVITMGGRTDLPPFSFLDGSKAVTGFSIDVARLIEAEATAYLGKPVKLEFQQVNDPATLFRQVSHGETDLACGAQFTWEREMFVDFSLPYSLSGIRVLSRDGRIDGSPQSLVGKRIGVLAGGLGDTTIADLQPKALRQPFPGLNEAVEALRAGKVDAVAGDSLLLMAIRKLKGKQGLELRPEQPLARYAVGCIMPENNSTFRNLVNIAIARLLQSYLNDDPAAVAIVNRWFGPQGILELPTPMIKAYFAAVMLNYEQIQVASPSTAK
jgi:polar amino acid transport system substrate-binding protein